jgi:hypothetical protein
MELTQEERDFAAEKWRKTLEEHPKFYDGNVTAILDVIYDENDSKLSFIMAKAKYSACTAMRDPDYPNQARREDFVSFGLGVMVNFKVDNDTLLMVERSQKVHNEKGAISVPGGSLEYKEDRNIPADVIKDGVRDGLPNVALSELKEEVFPDLIMDGFNINLSSICWEKGGLGVYFETQSQARNSTLGDVRSAMAGAEDSYEHSGVLFVDVANGKLTPENENSNSRLIPQQIIDGVGSPPLQASGTFALATQLYREFKDSYERVGSPYSGMAPHPQGLASKFPMGLTIIDACMLNNLNKIPRTICSAEEVSAITGQTNEKERGI